MYFVIFLKLHVKEICQGLLKDFMLHSQTLSKQMKDLEQELGKKLFKRGSTSVSLTDEVCFCEKEQKIYLAMADKITNEFQAMDDITGGDIYIGCAESYLVKYLARAVKKLSSIYPNIHYHVTSGDTEQVTEHHTL